MNAKLELRLTEIERRIDAHAGKKEKGKTAQDLFGSAMLNENEKARLKKIFDKHNGETLDDFDLHELLYIRLCLWKSEGMLQDTDLSTKTDDEISDIDIRAYREKQAKKRAGD
jgi:hypothetical protein